MTVQSAQAFWTRVRDDQEFRKKMADATSDEELQRLLVEAGFTVTSEELRDALDQWKQTPEDCRELSDEDLEKVAGGSIGNRYLAGARLLDLQVGMSVVAPTMGKG